LEDATWSNKEFHAALANTTKTNFAYMKRSWMEQRDWGINFPIESLGDTHPLAIALKKEFKEMKPSIPSLGAYSKVTAGSTIKGMGGWAEVSFNKETGAINGLVDTWAGDKNPLFELKYQTLTLPDFNKWHLEYIVGANATSASGSNEYGKPASMMNAKPTPVSSLTTPVLEGVFISPNKTEVIVITHMPQHLTEFYGAPERTVTKLNFSVQGEIQAEVQLYNKTATRLAEAMYVSFNPASDATSLDWSMEKLGSWIDPLDVADGGSKGLHCVTRLKASRADGGGSMLIDTPDAALARWDKPFPFPTPLYKEPDMELGLHMVLFNNMWNTNYPFWFPFDEADKDLQFRFTLQF